jgi:hypothetical protein
LGERRASAAPVTLQASSLAGGACSSVFHGVDLATTNIPILRDKHKAYEGLRADREQIGEFYAEFDQQKYFPIDAG